MANHSRAGSDIYQNEMLAHSYRQEAAGWIFQSIAGPDTEVALPSVGIAIPLAALHERALPEGACGSAAVVSLATCAARHPLPTRRFRQATGSAGD